jgi:hypothetical protein
MASAVRPCLSSHSEKQTHQYITMFDDKFFGTIICFGHGKIAGFWRVVLFQMFYGWLLSNQDIVVKHLFQNA